MSALDRQARVEWFTAVSQRLGVPLDPAFNLITAVPINAERFQAMREATLSYLHACLGPSGKGMVEQAMLELAATTLANRTPNGVVIPKREFQVEFNQLQKIMADWLRDLDLDDLIGQICCPMVVRLAKGESNPQLELSRPYSSSKIHSDIWTGEPPNHVGIRIPVLGDIERTTIEFFHPPVEFEERWMRWLDDYDEAKDLASRSPQYPITLQHGAAYFIDGTVLHRTAKKGGGARVSLHVELRRLIPEQDRQLADQMSDSGRLAHYLSREEWYQYGTSKFMRPKDTYEDALKGIFAKRPADEPMYDTVNRL